MNDLTEHERHILNAVAGHVEWPAWGAWVGACISSLRGMGLITSEINPALTHKGRAALDSLH